MILKFLIKDYENNNNLTDYYQLQPITLDKSLNSVLFSLGMLLSTHIVTNPEMIFNYMIKIGLVRNVAYIVEKANKEEYDFSLNDMVRHCSLVDDIDLRHIMCVMTAYLRSTTERVPGIFEISPKYREELFNAKNGNYIGKYIAQLPYSCSRDSQNSKDYYEYSIYTLLATLFDMIRAMESGEEFENTLKKNAQPREYLMVLGISDSVENEENGAEDYEFNSMENDSVVKFSKVLNQWVELIKSIKKYVQPYVIAKICTRIYYAYSNVKPKAPRALKTVAEIMQECILLMFNSVIIEEFSENNPSKILPNSKTVISRKNEKKVFYENMKVVNAVSVEDIPLCKIFLTCPLFLFFIDFSDKKNDVLADFYKKITSDFDTEFYKKNAYKVLKDSEIKVKDVSSKKKGAIKKDKTANNSDKTGSQKSTENKMLKNTPKEDNADENKPTGANGADGNVDASENATVQTEGTINDSNLVN